MHKRASLIPCSVYHEQGWHGQVGLYSEYRVQIYRIAVLWFHGESGGHCALVNHIQIQLSKIKGGPHGGTTQGCQQFGKGEESFTVTLIAKTKPTNAEFNEPIQVEQIHEVSGSDHSEKRNRNEWWRRRIWSVCMCVVKDKTLLQVIVLNRVCLNTKALFFFHSLISWSIIQFINSGCPSGQI